MSVEETKQEGITVGKLHVTPGRAPGLESYMCSALNTHGQDRQRFNLTLPYSKAATLTQGED